MLLSTWHCHFYPARLSLGVHDKPVAWVVVLQVIGFLTNLVSRRFEYQADRYVTAAWAVW